MNAAFGDRVFNNTGVVAHIGRFYFGDVQVACLLGNKSPCVLDDERWVLVEDPCEGKLCGQSQRHKGHESKHISYL